MKTSLTICFFFVLFHGSERVRVAESRIQFTIKDRILSGHTFRSLSSLDWFQCLQACDEDSRCISYSFDKQKAPGAANCLLHECGFLNECAAHDSLIFSKESIFHQLRPVEVGGGFYWY